MARRQPAARAVTWGILIAYGAIVSGIPLPLARPAPPPGSPAASRLADKDRSRPFPCMDKPCGCATAEQCFSNCCCNSPAELLAWAEARRLDPATLLALHNRVAAAQAPAATAACCSPEAARATCCATAPPTFEPDVCDEYRSLAAEPCCCETAAAPDDQPEPVGHEGDHDAAPRMISLRAMLACGGILAGWSAAMTSLPPPPPVCCAAAMSLVASIVVDDDDSLCPDLPTDTPPPRA